jgi:hypothetical protein
MTRAWLLALPFALLATPAFAISCDNSSDGIRFGFSGNLTISGGIHIGEPYTEEELNTFDQMALRRRGIEATRVERWNGCLRAWVKGENGREQQQFFDPTNYDRLDLTFRP